MKTTIAFGFCFTLLACGGSATTDPSSDTSALAGTWTGEWRSVTGVGGAATMNLTATSDGVSGTISFTGSPCFASGAIYGTVSGGNFDGAITAGTIDVSLSGTITGSQWSGTYDALSAGACTGDTGTFTASH
jgi:hypothetical protein